MSRLMTIMDKVEDTSEVRFPADGEERSKNACEMGRYPRIAGERSCAFLAQRRLWFSDSLESASAAYNVTVMVRLIGALDPRRRRTAMNGGRESAVSIGALSESKAKLLRLLARRAAGRVDRIIAYPRGDQAGAATVPTSWAQQ
jgi:hypothetical protein